MDATHASLKCYSKHYSAAIAIATHYIDFTVPACGPWTLGIHIRQTPYNHYLTP